VWLTPHLRDPQPEGERERESSDIVENTQKCPYLVTWATLPYITGPIR